MTGAEWELFLYWLDGHRISSSVPQVPVFLFRASHHGISCAEGSPEYKNVLNYHLRTYCAYVKDRKEKAEFLILKEMGDSLSVSRTSVQ